MSRNKIAQRNSISNPLETLMNILPCDRPIRSIQIIENYESCPAHFAPLHKTLDTDSDADLFKENILFGKRNTRYLCISKTEGVPGHVVEKLRIIGNNENLANEGFISIKSTSDSNQKAWRKKQLVYKLSKTEAVTECITDIIILTKFNRHLTEGFEYLGELERVHICYKVAPIKPEITDFTHQIENLKIQSNIYPSANGDHYYESLQMSYQLPSPNNRPMPLRKAPLPPSPIVTANNTGTLSQYHSDFLGVPFVLNPRLKIQNVAVELPKFADKTESLEKNLLEVPKLEFDFTFDGKFDDINFETISQKLRSLSSSLPQVTLPETVSLSIESLRKLEVYEYLLRSLQHLLILFNTINFFCYNLNINLTLTTQINATISNFYCFLSQIMEIINYSNKKTWEELKTAVNDIRKKFSSLSCSIPSNIHFRQLADGRLRIYFLCAQSKYDTLLYVDVNPNEQSDPSIFQWHPVLESSIGSNLTSLNASRELQLLLERKRLPAWGISSYEFHKRSGKIIFPACNSLYMCLDTGFNTTPLFPTELRTCQNQDWSPFDPQICPQNSDLVAYVCGNDIYVNHSISGHGERLTHAHSSKRNDPLSAGVPSYVMQEEFNRYQGFWWQPTSTDGIYRICYEEVDESDVSVFSFPSAHSFGADEYRFPRAGSPNAKSTIKMVEFRLSESLRITEVCIKELQVPLIFLFPYMEYLVRIGWTPDSKYVWTQLLNRQQQHLELILIPVESFCCEPYNSNPSSPESGSEKHLWKSMLEKPSKPIQVIYTERSSQWINVHDLLHFLEINDDSVQFIWASEESGYRHLYDVTSSLEVKPSQNGVNTHSAFCDEYPLDENLKSRIVKKTTLTMGEWEVLGKNLWVDRRRNLVYFMGLAHSPLEKHLYVFNLLNPDKKRLLTTPGSTNTVEFNESCSIIVRTHSNTNQLPSTEIVRIEQRCENGTVDGIELTPLGYMIVGNFDNSEYTPLIHNITISSGETLYALVFKPHNFKPGMVYPTVLNVYGGPEVQTVSNSFKGMRQLRMHMLASQGYCVICIDSRGSRHRGVQFESHLRRRLGTVELADQVEVFRILAKQLGYIDLNRVAIHGWSYGGYLSLMGLVQYPDLFKVAIAGAPVTSWEFYDTGYTERYMDLPENNRQGYVAGSVLSYINKFPDEANRLLLIHGLIDENVHFYHTSQLISQLIKANKPYSLQIYPGERHSLRSLESSKHYETFLLSFLQDNL